MYKNKDTHMKKIGIFFILALYVLGVIGGIGYALYNSAYLIALGVIVVAAMALPTAMSYMDKLME